MRTGIKSMQKIQWNQQKINEFAWGIFLFFDVADENGDDKVLIMNTVITYIYSFFLKIKTTNFRRIYIIYILDKDIKFGFKKKPTLSISFNLSTTTTLLLCFKVNEIELMVKQWKRTHWWIFVSIIIFYHI